MKSETYRTTQDQMKARAARQHQGFRKLFSLYLRRGHRSVEFELRCLEFGLAVQLQELVHRLVLAKRDALIEFIREKW